MSDCKNFHYDIRNWIRRFFNLKSCSTFLTIPNIWSLLKKKFKPNQSKEMKRCSFFDKKFKYSWRTSKIVQITLEDIKRFLILFWLKKSWLFESSHKRKCIAVWLSLNIIFHVFTWKVNFQQKSREKHSARSIDST